MLLQSSFINLLLRFSLGQMTLVYRYFKSKLQCTKSLCVRTQKVFKELKSSSRSNTSGKHTEERGKKLSTISGNPRNSCPCQIISSATLQQLATHLLPRDEETSIKRPMHGSLKVGEFHQLCF